MAWCPVCKNEYRPGITHCADCKVELVEKLKEEKELRNVEEYASALAFEEEESDAMTWDEKQDGDETEIEHTEDGILAQRQGRRVYKAFVNSEDKAKDNQSSAYTLLGVGSVGLVAVILIFTGVLPIFQNIITTKYMICGVMGAMFVLFIVCGFVSMRNSKILFVKAQTENSLSHEMTAWCKENLSADTVDEGLFDGEECPEEQKYFKRAQRMKECISEQFMNLDEAFLDNFVDEFYQELFENE